MSRLLTTCSAIWLLLGLVTSRGEEPIIVAEPIQVTATRFRMNPNESPASMVVMNKEEIRASGATTLDDALRQIPGFNTFKRVSSMAAPPAGDPENMGVSLRGIGPGGASRTLVLVDGVPANDAYTGAVYWGEIPLENIAKIEVMRGAGSDVWGDLALGGVINIITESPIKQSLKAKASGGSYASTDDDLYISSMKGPFALGLRGSYFHTGGWIQVSPDQRGPLDQEIGSEHSSFNGCLEFFPDPGLSLYLKGSAYGESRKLGTPYRNSDAQRRFITAGGSWRGEGDSFANFKLFSHDAGMKQQFSIANGLRTTETPFQNQKSPSRDWGGSLVWNKRYLSSHTLGSGMDFRQISGESHDVLFNSSGTGISELRDSAGQQTLTGLFIQDVFSLSPETQVSFATRLDYYRSYNGRLTESIPGGISSQTDFPEQNRGISSSKLTFHFQLLNGFAVEGAGYTGFRAPTLSELYRRFSVEDQVFKENPGLNPEYLQGGEIGFDFFHEPFLDSQMTFFWNNLTDVSASIISARDPDTGEVIERTRTNIPGARVRGVETDIKLQLNPQWTLKANLLYSDATITSSPQEGLLEGKRLLLVPWLAAGAGISYHNPAILNAELHYLYTSDEYDDAENLRSLPEYYVLNLNLSRPIPLCKSEIFLTVENLLDRSYLSDMDNTISILGEPRTIRAGMRIEF